MYLKWNIGTILSALLWVCLGPTSFVGAWSSEHEPLPDIEAGFFPIQVLKRSISNKVYLLGDSSNRQPSVGRIILLKKENDNVMALQVLKNYPESHSFAAKRIKRYGEIRLLSKGEEYRAFEKKADLLPGLSKTDKDFEQKLNRDIPDYDPEVDQRSPIKPKTYDTDLDEVGPVEKKKDPELKSTNQAPLESIDSLSDQPNTTERDEEPVPENIQEEPHLIDPYLHWLTAGFGYIKNNGPPSLGGSHSFTSGGLRYGIRVAQNIYLDLPKLQDSLVLEGGFYIYKTLNYATQGDAYGMLSLIATLRYNLFFSEKFGVFVYGGVLRNSVSSSSQSEESSLNALNSVFPAGGAGLLIQMGPSWYARVDVGIESIGLGLILRF